MMKTLKWDDLEFKCNNPTEYVTRLNKMTCYLQSYYDANFHRTQVYIYDTTWSTIVMLKGCYDEHRDFFNNLKLKLVKRVGETK